MKNIAARVEENKPIVIIMRIELKTKEFLVITDVKKEERYRIEIASKYLNWDI